MLLESGDGPPFCGRANGSATSSCAANNDYESEVTNLAGRSGSATQYGLHMGSVAGVKNVNRPMLFGDTYPLVIQGDLSIDIYSAWIQTESDNIVGGSLGGSAKAR